MRTRVLAVLLLTVAGAACGSDSTTAPTTTSPAQATELFFDTLPASGTKSFTFTVTTAGTVSVTLASLVAGGNPVAANVALGVGTPSGTTCTLAAPYPISATPALTAQINASLPAGSQCVAITDSGSAGPFDFAIRIVHP